MYRLTLDAAADMEGIANFIGKESPQGAVSVLENLMAKFEFLGQFPRAGELCSEMGKDVRITVAGNYVVYYRPEGDHATILRVVHGARDLHSLDPD